MGTPISRRIAVALLVTLAAALGLAASAVSIADGESDSTSIRKAVRNALKSERPEDRAAGVRKLGMYLPDSAAVRGIKAVLVNEREASVLLEAVEACKTEKAESLFDVLLKLVSHPDIDVHLQSAKAIHIIDSGRARKDLHKLCRTSSASALPCLRALISLSKRGEYSDLLKYLEDRNPAIRSLAISALVELGAVKESEFVAKMLADPAEPVRRAAIQAVAHLREKAAIPRLIALLSDKQYSDQAYFALRELAKEQFDKDRAVWHRWWEANSEDFRPPEYEYLSAREPVKFFEHSPKATRVVFMLDLSDSMGSGHNSSLETQYKELSQSLFSMPPTLSFNLVAYSRSANAFVPTAVRADMPSKLAALKWLRMQGTDKYTSSFEGFKKALAVRDAEVIFFAGNGLPNWGELPTGENAETEDNVVTAVKELREEENPKARIFTVAFPFEPDLHEADGGNLLPREHTKRVRTFEKRAAGFFRLLAALNNGEFCYVDKGQSDR